MSALKSNYLTIVQNRFHREQCARRRGLSLHEENQAEDKLKANLFSEYYLRIVEERKMAPIFLGVWIMEIEKLTYSMLCWRYMAYFLLWDFELR